MAGEKVISFNFQLLSQLTLSECQVWGREGSVVRSGGTGAVTQVLSKSIHREAAFKNIRGVGRGMGERGGGVWGGLTLDFEWRGI